MICSRCGTNAANDATVCPRCGAPLAMAASPQGAPGPYPAQGTPGPYSAPPGPPSARPGGTGTTPAFRFELKRLSRAELTTGIATLVLMIALFLPWFSVSVSGFGVSASGSGSGTDAHGYLWLTFIVGLVILALLVARAGWDELPVRLPLTADQILLAATGLNVLVVLIAFLFKPSGLGLASVGWDWGAFVALIAAIVAVAPIVAPAIQARSART